MGWEKEGEKKKRRRSQETRYRAAVRLAAVESPVDVSHVDDAYPAAGGGIRAATAAAAAAKVSEASKNAANGDAVVADDVRCPRHVIAVPAQSKFTGEVGTNCKYASLKSFDGGHTKIHTGSTVLARI